MTKQTIGFVGTGVMGKSMAEHLIKEGYTVNVFNRTKSKADSLIEQGAEWCDTVKLLSQNSDVIISIVGYPKDVESIYLSEEGILNHAKEGSIVIDMTTSSPALAEKIYEKAKSQNIKSLDAPVSGGDVGAKNAALTIMVGGDEDAYRQVENIFKVIGKNVVYQGKSGNGQHTKLSNQIAIAAGMLGVAEAIIYAEEAGLNIEKVFNSIEHGAAGSWSLSNLGPRMVKNDYAAGFYVKHFIKDMKIAIEESEKMGLYMPGLLKAKEVYDALSEAGFDDNGTQSVIQLLKNQIEKR
ncbi:MULTISPECIES: NAD(P)-dependent oxidoreductase [Mammaliicoccus]|uniref:6-phosphogluconate dehydrogenase, decarboxylating n=1 Tax=Mammaliicoccus vitulinus TaxID=71237 RepID=A0A2T4PRF2_9STAP|nr:MULTISPECIES: NAD(P)-dependent oxidoreductase [Mammaliicoccus]MBM6630075.1 NAD(P)-dependent oxidoreductase [Mammaliicoccus vitulinus]MBO3076983.1 NAD(P)-dependent oxidoreductase [Mammaliicoccus vitulinus]MEB7656647.1 NAD(P)-dependent oxidoreductase [Mammaliicoccus vitulinus]PTI28655.1 NAD(P)-dependent oxidoreductase [Mammaliicoccus vitulinus]PTI71245.1 NAD(P)-dependent oxidoreductase [Mammaliicoccus vitulinus]